MTPNVELSPANAPPVKRAFKGSNWGESLGLLAIYLLLLVPSA